MYANIGRIVVVRSVLCLVSISKIGRAASTYEAELLLKVEGHSDNKS